MPFILLEIIAIDVVAGLSSFLGYTAVGATSVSLADILNFSGIFLGFIALATPLRRREGLSPVLHKSSSYFTL